MAATLEELRIRADRIVRRAAPSDCGCYDDQYVYETSYFADPREFPAEGDPDHPDIANPS